jgi:DNA-binding transcriptional LysR family regulator
MQLRDLDLNLLLVLHHVLRQGSASAAAQSLGLTQPAISNALKRLRQSLGDELFVRSAQGLTPTPYALQLAEPVAHALQGLQTALTQRDHFDAAHSQRVFRVSMTDIGEIHFMPALMDALRREAPGVRIETVRPHDTVLKAAMAAGDIDLAVGPLPDLQSGFFQRQLFVHQYVCLFRADHPQAQAPLSLAQFSALEHVDVVQAHTAHADVQQRLARAGVQRVVRLQLPHFIALGPILQRSDLIATVPQRLAQGLQAPFGLVSSVHPVALPEITIRLFWHVRQHRDPANQWLRQCFIRLFAEDSALRPAARPD